MNSWHFHYCSKTDIGKKRKQNEDYLAAYSLPIGMLFLISDGMGGHVGGQMAATMTVETVKDEFKIANEASSIEALIRFSFQKADDAVKIFTAKHRELQGMGTTLLLGLFRDKTLYVGSVGDSRLYRIRNRHCELLTKDHSLVQELIDSGIIAEHEADFHPHRNVITHAIGANNPSPDFYQFEVEENDIFVFCTDGLSQYVQEVELSAIINHTSIEDATNQLIALANDKGGSDNITLHIVQVGTQSVDNTNVQNDIEIPTKSKGNTSLYSYILYAISFVILIVLLVWIYVQVSSRSISESMHLFRDSVYSRLVT